MNTATLVGIWLNKLSSWIASNFIVFRINELMNGLLQLNKLTENIQWVGLLRFPNTVADLALDNLPVPGPVQTRQHQHWPVLTPEHLLPPEEPLVGHEAGVGLGFTPEDGRVPLPDDRWLSLQSDARGELHQEVDWAGLRHTLGGVERLAGETCVVMRLLHRQFENRASVFTFSVW